MLARPSVASADASASVFRAGLCDFFERPAGQAVFEQIGMAVQGRLEELGLQATSTPPDLRLPGMTVLRTGHDRHVSYLASQIYELTAGVGSILPNIPVATDSKAQFVEWENHWPQTGDPTHQLREKISATLQLLNELHDIAKVKLDPAMLADKMSKLSLNLADLGLGDEAFGVPTIIMVLHAGGDSRNIAGSLSTLSVFLFRLGRRDDELKASEEAVSIHRMLAADRPHVFRPHLPLS